MSELRKGRININSEGKRIGSSVEHLRDGDPVEILNQNNDLLYTSKFNRKKFNDSR